MIVTLSASFKGADGCGSWLSSGLIFWYTKVPDNAIFRFTAVDRHDFTSIFLNAPCISKYFSNFGMHTYIYHINYEIDI